MSKEILDESYLCKMTGQDVEVSKGKVICPAIRDSSNCLQNTLGSGMCFVYMIASRERSQSQPKYTEQTHQRIGLMGEPILVDTRTGKGYLPGYHSDD